MAWRLCFEIAAMSYFETVKNTSLERPYLVFGHTNQLRNEEKVLYPMNETIRP